MKLRYKNNPLNIRCGNGMFIGQCGTDNGFCEFNGIRDCIRAALLIFRTYNVKYKCKVLEDIITRWAPPSENNTSGYIKFVTDKICFHRGVVVELSRPLFIYDLLSAMCLFESGYKLSKVEFDSAYYLFMSHCISNDLFEDGYDWF